MMDNRDELIEIKGNLIGDRSLLSSCLYNIKHDIKDDKFSNRIELIKRIEELELYTKTLNLRIKELNELTKPTHDDKIVLLDYLDRRFKKREAQGYKKTVGDTPCIFCVHCWSRNNTIKRNCDTCKKNGYALWVVDVRNPDFLKKDIEFHQKLNATYREIESIDVLMNTFEEFKKTYGDKVPTNTYEIMKGTFEQRKKDILTERKNLYKEYCDD